MFWAVSQANRMRLFARNVPNTAPRNFIGLADTRAFAGIKALFDMSLPVQRRAGICIAKFRHKCLTCVMISATDIA